MRRTTFQLIVATTVAAGLVLTGCAQGAGSTGEPAGRESDASPRTDRTLPEEASGEATAGLAEEERRPRCDGGAIVDHAFDVTDDRLLVGFADNVFVGRVTKKAGSESSVGSGIPYTMFSVEVLENVKGNLDGASTVAQAGGYDSAAGCVKLMEGDELLKPGQEVLFVTRYDGRNRRHQITTSGYGDLRVGSRPQREALVQRFERAEKHQVDPARGR